MTGAYWTLFVGSRCQGAAGEQVGNEGAVVAGGVDTIVDCYNMP
jgi:hypothetical protein